MDLLSYLVLDTSFYTAKQFKAFKSLEAYNQMVSGFTTSVQGKVIAGKYVVLAKMHHSQRMNDPPIPIWIISSEEGTVISAHCMGCKNRISRNVFPFCKGAFLYWGMDKNQRETNMHPSQMHVAFTDLCEWSFVR